MPLLPLHPSLKLKLSNVPRHININKEFTMKMDSLCRLRTDSQDHLYDGSINSTITPNLSSIYQNVSFKSSNSAIEKGVFPLPFCLEEFKHLLSYEECISLLHRSTPDPSFLVNNFKNFNCDNLRTRVKASFVNNPS